MPKGTTTDILLAAIVLTALVISFIGWSMEKREADADDLLALPPKKP
jgi:hypothetical protein